MALEDTPAATMPASRSNIVYFLARAIEALEVMLMYVSIEFKRKRHAALRVAQDSNSRVEGRLQVHARFFQNLSDGVWEQAAQINAGKHS